MITPFGAKQVRHSCREVVEIRNLRQHIVADDEIGSRGLPRRDAARDLVRKTRPVSEHSSPRRLGDVGGRLDSQNRNTQRQKVLKQISVVAGDLKDLALRPKTKPSP